MKQTTFIKTTTTNVVTLNASELLSLLLGSRPELDNFSIPVKIEVQSSVGSVDVKELTFQFVQTDDKTLEVF